MVYFENPDGDVVIRDGSDKSAPYLDVFTQMQGQLADYPELDSQIDEIIALMEQGRNGVPAPRRTRSVDSTPPA
jgi:hypothetical protein